MSTDVRPYATFFQVHYWPHLGRIMTINKASVTEVAVVALDLSVDGITMLDAIEVTALALAEAGKPAGDLVRHDADGRMTAIDVVNLARTVIHLRTFCRFCGTVITGDPREPMGVWTDLDASRDCGTVTFTPYHEAYPDLG